MATIPDTKWVSSAGVDIAYQTFGQGDVDLVVVPSWVGNIELFWDLPEAARMFEQLGTFCRVVLFDKRGTGISDRATVPTLEERAEDIGVVMDAVGVTGAALAGWGDAALIAATFAATHPERVQALLLGSFAPRGAARDEEGDGVDQTTLDGVTIAIEQGWGEALLAPIVAPSLAHDERFLAWWRRWERLSGTPASAAAEFRWEQQIDARALLPFIQAPTLILHRRDAAVVDREVVRRAAEAIPNAHYVELPGADSIPVAGDVEAVISEIEEFLTGSRALTDTNRVLATVLFTDIVNSTERAQALGDRSWGDLLDAHNSRVRRSVNQFGGTEIDTAGDGFFITFDGPAPRCSLRNQREGRHLGDRAADPGRRAYRRGRAPGQRACRSWRPRRRPRRRDGVAQRGPRHSNRQGSRSRIWHRIRGPRHPQPKGRSRPMAPLRSARHLTGVGH